MVALESRTTTAMLPRRTSTAFTSPVRGCSGAAARGSTASRRMPCPEATTKNSATVPARGRHTGDPRKVRTAAQPQERAD